MSEDVEEDCWVYFDRALGEAKEAQGGEIHGLQGIIALQFMDSDGDIGYRWLAAGEVPLSQTIGLLELVKAQILIEYMTGGEEEEEE
jgi:hypothetical protein